MIFNRFLLITNYNSLSLIVDFQRKLFTVPSEAVVGPEGREDTAGVQVTAHQVYHLHIFLGRGSSQNVYSHKNLDYEQ